MKKFSSIVILCFLVLNNTACAAMTYFELEDYLQEQIYNLEDQLDDHTLDQYSSQCGYLVGLKTAYRDVLKKIHAPMTPCAHCKN